MSIKDSGWIKLHRQIEHNSMWTSEPFTRGQAWIDLLLLANYKYGYIYFRGNKIIVKRGQVGWSQRRLASRWKWGRKRVARLFLDLEKEQQIAPQKNNKSSIITILNYERYQSEEPQTVPQTTPQTVPQRNHRRTTNKNVKKERIVKNNIPASEAAGDEEKKPDQVKPIFEAFQMTVNPTINYGNTTQRKAAQDLVDKLGEEKAIALTKYACKIQGDSFAPVVTTPFQLREKEAQVRVYWERQHAKRQDSGQSQGQPNQFLEDATDARKRSEAAENCDICKGARFIRLENGNAAYCECQTQFDKPVDKNI